MDITIANLMQKKVLTISEAKQILSFYGLRGIEIVHDPQEREESKRVDEIHATERDKKDLRDYF